MLTRLHRATSLLRVVTAIAFLVGVFVWPTPEEARADYPVLDIEFDVVWINGTTPYDIEAYVEILDEFGESVGAGFSGFLTPNSNFDHYTLSFVNVPDDATQIRVTWEQGDYNWDNLAHPAVTDIAWEFAWAWAETHATVPE